MKNQRFSQVVGMLMVALLAVTLVLSADQEQPPQVRSTS